MNDKKMQRTLKISFQALALILLLPVLLTGCGGGGGGGSSDPVVENIDPTGYYTGSITTTSNGTLSDAQFLVNGTRMMIVSDTNVVVYDGQLTMTGSDFTSTMTIYHSGIKVGTTNVSGSFVEDSQIVSSTTLTGTGYGSGTMEATYSATYNARPATKAILAGRRWSTSGLNEDTAAYRFDVDADGALIHVLNATTFEFSGCEFNGTILPIGTSHLYEVNITATNCLDANNNTYTNGSYTGLAVTKDFDGTQDNRLVFTITNDQFSTGDDFLHYF